MELATVIVNQLLNKPYLTFLVLGTFLAIITVSTGEVDASGFKLTVEDTHDKILAIATFGLLSIGFVMSVITFALDIKSQKSHLSKQIHKEDNNAEAIIKQEKSIEELQDTLQRTKELVEGKDDFISLAVKKNH